MNMENISKNYLRMREKCVTYLDRIDILREQVYGRFVYLDCIEPYYSNKKNNPKPIGLEDFINTIVNYCTSFDETVSPKFMESMTEEDVVFAKALCTYFYQIGFFISHEARQYANAKTTDWCVVWICIATQFVFFKCI